MYDTGDDDMKKAIGEAMLKSKQKQENPGLDDDMGGGLDLPPGSLGGGL
jgi:hypothetical protein